MDLKREGCLLWSRREKHFFQTDDPLLGVPREGKRLCGQLPKEIEKPH
ncbi:MAG: hypothetical protein ACE5JN_13475 [Candidatus Methylomirabilia bacterium]